MENTETKKNKKSLKERWDKFVFGDMRTTNQIEDERNATILKAAEIVAGKIPNKITS